jgi:phosphoglycolate phosphatase-like HAD superfamily hydrolase
MSSSAPAGHGLKAVIFDLDGVVASTHTIHLQAWKAFLTEQSPILLVVAADGVVSQFPQPALDHFARLFEVGYVSEDSPPHGRSDCTVVRGA